jgi:hypothetical protein
MLATDGCHGMITLEQLFLRSQIAGLMVAADCLEQGRYPNEQPDPNAGQQNQNPGQKPGQQQQGGGQKPGQQQQDPGREGQNPNEGR